MVKPLPRTVPILRVMISAPGSAAECGDSTTRDLY